MDWKKMVEAAQIEEIDRLAEERQQDLDDMCGVIIVHETDEEFELRTEREAAQKDIDDFLRYRKEREDELNRFMEELGRLFEGDVK